MIFDSDSWRRDLLQAAGRITAATHQRRPSQRLHIAVEKDVVLSAYVTRKLMDAKLLSTTTPRVVIPTVDYPAVGKSVTLMNWHHLDRLYDFSKGVASSLPLREVCNQVIHSFVFMLGTDAMTGPLRRVYFCSDRDRHRSIHELTLHQYADAMTLVGRDYPSECQMHYDKTQRDFVVTAW